MNPTIILEYATLINSFLLNYGVRTLFLLFITLIIIGGMFVTEEITRYEAIIDVDIYRDPKCNVRYKKHPPSKTYRIAWLLSYIVFMSWLMDKLFILPQSIAFVRNTVLVLGIAGIFFLMAYSIRFLQISKRMLRLSAIFALSVLGIIVPAYLTCIYYLETL